MLIHHKFKENMDSDNLYQKLEFPFILPKGEIQIEKNRKEIIKRIY